MARNSGKASVAFAKKLIQLFEAFEKYHFINNVICERVGNEVEKLYADVCISYSESTDPVKTTDELMNNLKGRLAKEEEFVVNFTQLSYDQLGLISYVFDRFNNFGLDPGQCMQFYNPDPKLRRRNYNIKHFLAQKPEAHLKLNKADADAVDNIGNLLVIYFKDNASLGNATPAEKIRRLKGDLRHKVENLRHVTDFVNEYGDKATNWGVETIRERANTMARKAYREVWKLT